MNRQTKDIALAFILSMLIHFGFLLASGRLYFGGLGDLSREGEDAFSVKILPEEQDRMFRQPRPDVEAERRERIREKVDTERFTVPEISDLPPLSVKESAEENLKTTYSQSVRDKIRAQEKESKLPELLAHSADSPIHMDILEVARDVGRESPSVQRRSLDGDSGDPFRNARAMESIDSTLTAMVASAPRMAGAPSEGIPGGPNTKWSPGLLPPKPAIDLSRPVENPPEVPQLYIKPDQVKEYISLDQFLSVELFVYHAPGDPKGYFMVRIRPNEKSKQLPVMNKDIIFVLDASGSMGRRTLAALKSGLKICLSKLREDDFFNVIGFKRDVIRFQEGLQPAIPARIQESLGFVDELEPSGRTDIYGSLEPISQLARGADHPFIIMLFSDGRPNVGVVDSREIINDLSSNLRVNSSIFAFGAGGNVNRYLLDLLSYRNKGFVEFSEDFQLMADRIEGMFQTLSDPLLINLTGDYGNVPEEDIYPKTLPDLYRGGEILIFGRYTNQKKFSLRIAGEARSQQKEFVIELDIPEKDNGPANLPQLWAFRKIYDLIGFMCQHGESEDRLLEIQQISQSYDVRTPYYQ